MKRLTAIFLTAILTVSLAGCGAGSGAAQAETTGTEAAETEATQTQDAQTSGAQADSGVQIPAAPALKTIEPADSFAGGSGTEEDPYLIGTAEQLALLSERCSREVNLEVGADHADTEAYYLLTADIALNDTQSVGEWGEVPPETQWTPIGEGYRFQGVFDGGGHTISGMYVFTDLSNDGANIGDPGSYPGLFGSLSGAVVRNLTLTDSRIVATGKVSSVGGIASNSYDSRIENCVSNVTIELYESTYAGGIAGWVQKGALDSCTFSGELLTAPGSTAGGIAGCATDFGEIAGCVNSGRIGVSAAGDALALAGGIAGLVSAGEDSTVIDCANEGTVDLQEADAGGLFGRISVGEIDNIHPGEETTHSAAHLTVGLCKNEGTVTAGSSSVSVGGIAGKLFCSSAKVGGELSDMSVILHDCVNSGTVQGAGKTGGIVGECASAAPWLFEKCGNTGGVVSAQDAAGGIAGQFAPATGECMFKSCFNEGEIRSGAGCAGGIAGGMFGFNLYVDESTAQPMLFTSCINRGKVSGESSIEGLGGILGSIRTSISTIRLEDCSNEGEIAGGENCRLGGILGSSAFANLAQYTGPAYVIRGCRNSGALIQGDGSTVCTSDLAGDHTLTEEEKDKADEEKSTFLVEGGNAAGGIVGYAKQGIVEDCTSSGKIFLDADTEPVFGYEGLLAASAGVNEERARVFCGGICGLYFYLASNGSTEENTGLRSCTYSGGAPVAAFVPLEHTGISGVKRTD